jgi:hypothetical protein
MEKWCIKRNSENASLVNHWFNKHKQHSQGSYFQNDTTYMYYPKCSSISHICKGLLPDYTEITFEQFKQNILKEQVICEIW